MIGTTESLFATSTRLNKYVHVTSDVSKDGQQVAVFHLLLNSPRPIMPHMFYTFITCQLQKKAKNLRTLKFPLSVLLHIFYMYYHFLNILLCKDEIGFSPGYF